MPNNDHFSHLTQKFLHKFIYQQAEKDQQAKNELELLSEPQLKGDLAASLTNPTKQKKKKNKKKKDTAVDEESKEVVPAASPTAYEEKKVISEIAGVQDQIIIMKEVVEEPGDPNKKEEGADAPRRR